MPQLRPYRIFISHAWDYNDAYYRLEKMLKEASNFWMHNYSVPEHDRLQVTTDAELERKLNDQIRPTQAVLIISGMYTNHRYWIQKEIDIARAMGKPIIGIRPWSSEKTPQAVAAAAVEMVGWNTVPIVGAIRRWAI